MFAGDKMEEDKFFLNLLHRLEQTKSGFLLKCNLRNPLNERCKYFSKIGLDQLAKNQTRNNNFLAHAIKGSRLNLSYSYDFLIISKIYIRFASRISQYELNYY